MLSANSGSKSNYSKKTILIVDDMPQVLEDLRQLLELTGLFEIVAEATDSLEAVQRACDLSPDAVILDLEMPNLDGYETTRLIKAHNPSTRVIILSAYGGNYEVERARVAGADGFVIKGECYEILVDAILGQKNSPNLGNFTKGE